MSKLDEKLWRIFSQFIRLRDAKDFSGGEYVKCCTCSHTGHWKDFDAGHFISRRHKATKFSEKNVNAQCKGCNGHKSGMQYKHGEFIDRKYGKDTAEKLDIQSRNMTKWHRFEYEFLIKEYTKKVKELKKELGVE